MTQKTLYKTDKYIVIEHPDCIGEDGKYGRSGYAVVNIGTSVIECTSMILPQAIYQAQGFNDSLVAQLEEKESAKVMSLVEMPTDDVVPN